MYIKDYHNIQGQKETNTPSAYLTDEMKEWIEKVWIMVHQTYFVFMHYATI
jgi:uncharacterized protein YecE (DUF72 family)